VSPESPESSESSVSPEPLVSSVSPESSESSESPVSSESPESPVFPESSVSSVSSESPESSASGLVNSLDLELEVENYNTWQDVNVIGGDGKTPLMREAATGDSAALSKLLCLGADPYLKYDGKTVFDYADNEATKEVLESYGKSYNSARRDVVLKTAGIAAFTGAALTGVGVYAGALPAALCVFPPMATVALVALLVGGIAVAIAVPTTKSKAIELAADYFKNDQVKRESNQKAAV
jgi:hypothetical protein